MSTPSDTKIDRIANVVFWGSIAATVLMLLGKLSGWGLSWWVVFSPVLVVAGIIVLCVIFMVIGFGLMAWQARNGD